MKVRARVRTARRLLRWRRSYRRRVASIDRFRNSVVRATMTHDDGSAGGRLDPVVRRPEWFAPLLIALAVLTSLTAALLTSAPSPEGITAPGEGSGAAIAVARVLLMAGAIAAVGCSLVPVLLRSGPIGRSRGAIRAARQWAVVAGLVWTVAAGFSLILLARDVTGSIGAVPEVVAELAVAKGLLISAACGALYSVLASVSLRLGDRLPAELLIGVALFGLLPLPLTGHRSHGSLHGFSVFAVELHVLSAALWVGGLAAIVLFLLRDRVLPAVALPRFSALATVCVVVLAVSGLFTGIITLIQAGTFPAGLVNSGYGILLLLKLAAFTALAVLALGVRRRVLPAVAAGRRSAIAFWCGSEVLVMAFAVGIAVVLTRTPAAG